MFKIVINYNIIVSYYDIVFRDFDILMYFITQKSNIMKVVTLFLIDIMFVSNSDISILMRKTIQMQIWWCNFPGKLKADYAQCAIGTEIIFSLWCNIVVVEHVISSTSLWLQYLLKKILWCRATCPLHKK